MPCGRWDFLSGEILEIPPEGALAPDSYEMQLGDKRSDILEAMIEKAGTLGVCCLGSPKPFSAT